MTAIRPGSILSPTCGMILDYYTAEAYNYEAHVCIGERRKKKETGFMSIFFSSCNTHHQTLTIARIKLHE